MHTAHIHQRNPLEIAELAAFDSCIGELPPEEQKRRRIAYLQQALTQVGYGKTMLKSMGCIMIPFAIIPIFWPVLVVMYFIIKRSQKMIDHYVVTACQYWDIDIPQ